MAEEESDYPDVEISEDYTARQRAHLAEMRAEKATKRAEKAAIEALSGTVPGDRTFTPAQINAMAIDAREGTANPEDARALLTLFCQCIEYNLIVPRDTNSARLLEHVREASRAYLENPGKVTIERTLGLVKRKGKPEAEGAHERRLEMAKAVLRHRLTGMSHQNALTEVAEQFQVAESMIGEAWKASSQEACVILHLERGTEWTSEQRSLLMKIYRKPLAASRKLFGQEYYVNRPVELKPFDLYVFGIDAYRDSTPT